MISEKIKILRDKAGMSQAQLAKKLDVTRSSVNAWEMGISAPSTSWLVELSNLFHVTTDYLLGLDDCITIRTNTLSDRAVTAILNTVEAFYENCKEL